MGTLQTILDYIFSFMAYVMLPLIILVIALLGRMRTGDALMSALKIAVGFAGVFIIFDFFVASIGIYSIKMADWNGIYVEKRTHIHGISITTISINGLMPYAVAMDRVFDLIPGIRSISYDPLGHAKAEGAQERSNRGSRFLLGILSEPMIIGTIVGLFLGLLAAYRVRELLELMVHIAAVMFLLPPCGKLIGDGVEPVSTRLKEIITSRFRGRHDLRVGMDSGPLLANRSVLFTA